MLRARLWYGPEGHGTGLDRIGRYLKGPLACRVEMRMQQRHGRSHEQIVLRAPMPLVIEIDRRPEVSLEATDLIARLPATAPPGLAERLAACTARLEVHDGPGGARFVPAGRPGRSVLMPLAFAMGGLVEEVQSGRLVFFPLPVPPRPSRVLSVVDTALAGVDRLLGLLALRPWPEGRPLPGTPLRETTRLPSPSPSPGPQALLPAPQARPDSR